jgi:predicted O-methyltransferase YrrM
MLANMSPVVPDSDLRAESIEGWMTRNELLWLTEQACSCTRIIEIGVWKGRSTMALCDALPDGGEVIAIDHFNGGRDQEECQKLAVEERIFDAARENLREHIESGKLRLMPMDSRDAFFWIQRDIGLNSVDMLFIDGGHDFLMVNNDISMYRSFVKPGGLISGHDYNENGVKDAVNPAFGNEATNPVDSIWAAKQT